MMELIIEPSGCSPIPSFVWELYTDPRTTQSQVTLDSLTSPAFIKFLAYETTIIPGTYSYYVSGLDSSTGKSVVYTLKVKVVTPCEIANLVDPSQTGQNLINYSYLGASAGLVKFSAAFTTD